MFITRKTLSILTLTVLTASPLAHAASAAKKIRCAFDIGSGETKFAIASITSSKGQTRVEKTHFESTPIPIKTSVVDGNIPDAVLDQLTTQLSSFKQKCVDAGATEFAGVATSGFRAAKKNGEQSLAKVAKSTGISLRIITGDEEAILGYLAVESTLKNKKSKLVVWDIGGGSQQFSMRSKLAPNAESKFEFISLDVGAASFRDQLMSEFKREPQQDLNPISKAEMQKAMVAAGAHAKKIPNAIKTALRQKNTVVVGIGGSHTGSIAEKVAHLVLKKKSTESYNLTAVETLAKKAVGLDTAQLQDVFLATKYPETQASNLAMVAGLMKELGIKRVQVRDVTLADGLFVDQKAWP
jgi:exopolyphosphatase/guanosine-5'-triphosphate,3'-diphosphate pyrophosphatase